MNKDLPKYSFLLLKSVVALSFFAAGCAKLIGVEMMIVEFQLIGFGQWLRYVTGAIEVVAAMLLFLPSKQFYGAILLVLTMIGAIFAHWLFLGPSAIPAIILGCCSGYIAYVYRTQRPFKYNFRVCHPM